jgi:two-component system, response regulator PdtaR
MHAFIIEDEYLIARSIQDSLEDLGFTAFSFARSEDAAILGAKAERIDLITADVRLLPGDGLKAVETICADRRIPVIFVTGYASELADRLEGEMSRTTVIQKPVRRDELADAVKALLGARVLERSQRG